MTTCILELQNELVKLQSRVDHLEEESIILQLRFDIAQDFIDAAFDL
tara:strand:- start:4134 stop:4274 length:141 start_codon:yes stop_codon:yes gene_type:complete